MGKKPLPVMNRERFCLSERQRLCYDEEVVGDGVAAGAGVASAVLESVLTAGVALSDFPESGEDAGPALSDGADFFA